MAFKIFGITVCRHRNELIPAEPAADEEIPLGSVSGEFWRRMFGGDAGAVERMAADGSGWQRSTPASTPAST